MARNKFDVDERLESPFRWKHLKRAGKYIVSLSINNKVVFSQTVIKQ